MEGDKYYDAGPNPDGTFPTVESIRMLPPANFYVVSSKPFIVAPTDHLPRYREQIVRWSRGVDVVGVIQNKSAGHTPNDICAIRKRYLHCFEPERPRGRFMAHVSHIDMRSLPVVWLATSDVLNALF